MYLESCQTGFTSRYGIMRVAFKIFATATASQIFRNKKSIHKWQETIKYNQLRKNSPTTLIACYNNYKYLLPFFADSVLHQGTPGYIPEISPVVLLHTKKPIIKENQNENQHILLVE